MTRKKDPADRIAPRSFTKARVVFKNLDTGVETEHEIGIGYRMAVLLNSEEAPITGEVTALATQSFRLRDVQWLWAGPPEFEPKDLRIAWNSIYTLLEVRPGEPSAFKDKPRFGRAPARKAPPLPDDLLFAREAAEAFDVPFGRIHKAMRDGRIPTESMLGRGLGNGKRAARRKDVDEFVRTWPHPSLCRGARNGRID